MSAELLYIFFIPVYALACLGVLFSRQLATPRLPTANLISKHLKKEKNLTVGAPATYTVWGTPQSGYPSAFEVFPC